ncbi:MAG: dienelactone hydrolase [Actinomycetota bacterium]|nr:dienelactone hydrolase [Actinomycetota bacterium]
MLTPGAGSGRDHPSLLAVEASLAPLGIAVDRVDFPYRIAGRRAPDRPPVLIQTVRSAADALARRLGVDGDRIALGGRSMGGRMCSMAVAEGQVVAGLVLVSYPLHPPGRPERLRTDHFAALRVPCLFISGTRDAFGAPEELVAATRAIRGPVTHVWIDGGDHGLGGREAEVAAAVRRWLARTTAPTRRSARLPGGPGVSPSRGAVTPRRTAVASHAGRPGPRGSRGRPSSG